MGTRFQKSASVDAGDQFLGTELKAMASNPKSKRLQVKEIYLKMGSEAKDWSVLKTFTIDGVDVEIPLRSDTASADTEVAITGSDADFSLLSGEQIQFLTSGATSAMQARVVYEEVDNSADRSKTDPVYTR